MAKIGENRKSVYTVLNIPRHSHNEAAYKFSLRYNKQFLSYEELKKPMFFYEKMAKIGENRFFSKTQKIIPRHCHKEATYQISLRYDQQFLSYEELKFLRRRRRSSSSSRSPLQVRNWRFCISHKIQTNTNFGMRFSASCSLGRDLSIEALKQHKNLR